VSRTATTGLIDGGMLRWVTENQYMLPITPQEDVLAIQIPIFDAGKVSVVRFFGQLVKSAKDELG